MMMKLFVGLVLVSTAAAQGIIFPGSSEGNSQDAATKVEQIIVDVLKTSTRDGVNFPPSNSNECVTPNNLKGICGPIKDCKNLIKLVLQAKNRNITNFLRGSICRILPQNLFVCCAQGPNEPGIADPVPIPTEDICGLPTGEKVVGGTEVAVGSWPWLTAVGIFTDNNAFLLLCGGTLITRRHVLTAGHCFVIRGDVPELTHVRLGDHDLTSDSDGVIPLDIRIQSRSSVGYNPFTQENDIELLFLEQDVTFNDFVRPACLPIGPSIRNRLLEGENATVTGWGRLFSGRTGPTSPIPMQATVPIVPLGPCSNTYQTRTLGTVVDNRNICAGEGAADACGGDSGGPLNYLDEDNGRYYVIGIVSHGIGCADSEFPGVYTRVDSFLDWIVNNIKQNSLSTR